MAPLFVLVATFCQNIFEDSFLVLVSVFVPHLLLLQLDCALTMHNALTGLGIDPAEPGDWQK